MNDLAKALRTLTGYPWQDCIEAARRTADPAMAREILPVISRRRRGVEYRCETCT